MKSPLTCAALLTASLGAQTPPCQSLNDSNTAVSTAITSFGFAGPNVNAWQFTANTVLFPQSLQIYTGNVNFAPGFETLELWDNDPVTNLPNARLAGGTWRIDPSLGAPATGNAWQGANLDAVTPLLQGNAYWIVWIDPGFSTVPTEPGGTTIPAARRSGTTWSAVAAPSALKFRILCNLLDGAYATPFGPACATSQGKLGTQFTNQTPSLGNGNFRLEGSGFLPGTTAILLFGFDPNWISLPIPGLPSGCALNTDVYTLFTGATGTGTTVRATAATGYVGHVAFPLPIPGDPNLVGLFLATQIGVLDAGMAVPLPLTMSNALRLYLY